MSGFGGITPVRHASGRAIHPAVALLLVFVFAGGTVAESWLLQSLVLDGCPVGLVSVTVTWSVTFAI